MHYCSIIIKPKSMSVAEARELAGEFLVRHGVADGYSTGNYRERLFYELDQDGKENYESERKRTVSIKEFSKYWEVWKEDLKEIPENEEYIFNNCWEFFTISKEEDYMDNTFLPPDFYEFYVWGDNEKKQEYNNIRRNLINEYIKGYKLAITDLINDFLESEDCDDFEVVLLDYHN